jgi:hypothetical protein
MVDAGTVFVAPGKAMLDLLILLLQLAWVAFGVTCLVIFAVLLRAGVQKDVRAAKSRRLLTQINIVHARHA